MIRIERSQIIRRPAKDIFELLASHERMPEFMPGVLKVERVSRGPVGVGATFKQENRLFGGLRTTLIYEIVEYQPYSRLATRSVSGPIEFTGGDTLESVDGGTRLTVNVLGQVRGIFKLLEPLVAISAKRNLDTSLTRMKTIFEALA